MEYTKVGKRGAVVIPAEMRRHHGLEEGTPVVIEDRPEGVLFRAAPVSPSQEERERFFAHLNDAVLATRRDERAWAEELADHARLDSTLMDGLDEEGEAVADRVAVVEVNARSQPQHG